MNAGFSNTNTCFQTLLKAGKEEYRFQQLVHTFMYKLFLTNIIKVVNNIPTHILHTQHLADNI